MSDELISHEAIERAFKPVYEVIGRLPDRDPLDKGRLSRAKSNLRVAEDYLHEIRDRAYREPEETEAS